MKPNDEMALLISAMQELAQAIEKLGERASELINDLEVTEFRNHNCRRNSRKALHYYKTSSAYTADVIKPRNYQYRGV